jgi:hypothetical protein
MNWVAIQTNTTAGGPGAPGFSHGQCLRLTAATVSDSETLSDSVASDAQTQPGRLLKLAASLAEWPGTTNLPLLGSHAGNVLRQLTVHSLSFKLAAVTVRAAVTVTVQRRLGRRLHGNPSLMMTRIMMT